MPFVGLLPSCLCGRPLGAPSARACVPTRRRPAGAERDGGACAATGAGEVLPAAGWLPVVWKRAAGDHAEAPTWKPSRQRPRRPSDEGCARSRGPSGRKSGTGGGWPGTGHWGSVLRRGGSLGGRCRLLHPPVFRDCRPMMPVPGMAFRAVLPALAASLRRPWPRSARPNGGPRASSRQGRPGRPFGALVRRAPRSAGGPARWSSLRVVAGGTDNVPRACAAPLTPGTARRPAFHPPACAPPPETPSAIAWSGQCAGVGGQLQPLRWSRAQTK